MNWVQTASGAAFNLSGEFSSVAIGDIAAGLAKINRFAGASRVPYSVAQHSLDVCRLVKKRKGSVLGQLSALLHDAHEIVINDIPSPAKLELRDMAGADHVEALSRMAQTRIIKGLGLPEQILFADQALIRQCDLQALAAEKRDLMASSPRSWIDLPVPDRKIIKPVGWRAAEKEFLKRYLYLLGKLEIEAGK